MDTIEPEVPAASRGLPLGVLVLVGVRIIDAVLLAAAAVGGRAIPGEAFWAARLPGVESVHLVEWAFAIASVLAAVGLLLRQRWGWTGTMLLTGAGLFFAIVSYVGGAGNDIRLIVLVVSAFYLNQRAVRDLYLGVRT